MRFNLEDVNSASKEETKEAKQKLQLGYTPVDGLSSNVKFNHSDVDPFGFTQTDFFIKDPSEIERIQANRQSAWDKAGNALARMVGSEFIGGTIHGLGAALDIVPQLLGGQSDFENFITEFGQEIMDETEEAFPIYRKDRDASFGSGAMSDWGWWMENSVSIASTVGLLIPGRLVGGSVGLITRALKTLGQSQKALGNISKLAKLSKLEKNWIQGISVPLTMRNAENYRESADVVKNIKDEALNKFGSMSDDEFNEWLNSEAGSEFRKEYLGQKDTYDENGKKHQFIIPPGSVSRENAANFVAGRAGWRTYWDNAPNLVFDVIQTLPLLNLYATGTRTGLLGKALGKSVGVKKAESVLKGIKLTGKEIAATRAKRIGINMGLQSTEGVEEMINGIAQNEGTMYGKLLLGQRNEMAFEDFSDRLDTYMQDPHIWEQAFWGFMGGVAFGGFINVYDKYKGSFQKDGQKTKDGQVEEVNSRILKITDAVRKLQDVNEGIDVFHPSYKEGRETAAKFQDSYNTEEEAQEAQKIAEETLKAQLGYNLGFNSSLAGQTDQLIDFLRSKEIKDVLIKNEFTTQENYSKDLNDLVQNIEEGEKHYKYYSQGMVGKAIDENFVNVLVSDLVNSEASVKYYKKKKAKAEEQFNNVYNNSSAVAEFDKRANEPGVKERVDALAKQQLLDVLEAKAEQLKEKSEPRFVKHLNDNITRVREELGQDESKLADEQKAELKKLLNKKELSNSNAIGEQLTNNLIDKRFQALLNEFQLRDVQSYIATKEAATGEILQKDTEEAMKKAKEQMLQDYKDAQTQQKENVEFWEDENMDAKYDSSKKAVTDQINNDDKIPDKSKPEFIKALVKHLDELKKKNITDLAATKEQRRQDALNEESTKLENINYLIDSIKGSKTVAEKIAILKRINRLRDSIDTVEDTKTLEAIDKKLKKTDALNITKILDNYTSNEDLNEALSNIHKLKDKDGTLFKELGILADLERSLIEKADKAQPTLKLLASFNKILADLRSQEEGELQSKVGTDGALNIVNSIEQLFEAILELNNQDKGSVITFEDFIKLLYTDVVLRYKQIGHEEFMDKIDEFKSLYKLARDNNYIASAKEGSVITNKKAENIFKDFNPVLEEVNTNTVEELIETENTNSISVKFPEFGDANTQRNTPGDIVLTEEQEKIYKALAALKPGSKLNLTLDKNSKAFKEDPTNTRNIPVIIRYGNRYIGRLPNMDNLDSTIDFVRRLISPEIMDLIDLHYVNLFKIRSRTLTKAELIRITSGENSFTKALLKILGYNEAIDNSVDNLNASTERQEYLKKFNHFLNLTFHQNENYTYFKDFEYDELKASYIRWYNQQVNDANNSNAVREALKNEDKVESTVQYMSPGNATFAINDKGNAVVNNLLHIFDNIEDIQILDVAKGKHHLYLEDKEGNPIPHEIYNPQGFKSYGAGYIIVKMFSQKEGKDVYLPVKLNRNYYRDSLTEEQAKYNKDLVSAIKKKLLNLAALKTQSEQHEAIKELKDYLIFDNIADDGSYQDVQHVLFRKFLSFNHTNKGEAIIPNGKYTLREGRATKEGKPTWTIANLTEGFWYGSDGTSSYKDKKDDSGLNFNKVLDQVVLNQSRNTNYSTLLGKQEFEDLLGNEYKSYKHFLVETNAVTTNLGKVVNQQGETLGYPTVNDNNNSRILGRPLKIKIEIKSKESMDIKTLRDFYDYYRKIDPSIEKYEEVIEIGERLGITIDWSKVNEETDALFTEINSVIYPRKNWKTARSENLIHETLHKIIRDYARTPEIARQLNKDLLGYNKSLIEAYKNIDETLFTKDELSEIKDIINVLQDAVNNSKDKADVRNQEVITYGLTNARFYKFLTSIESDTASEGKTLWNKLRDILVDLIESIFKINKADELMDIITKNLVDNTLDVEHVEDETLDTDFFAQFENESKVGTIDLLNDWNAINAQRTIGNLKFMYSQVSSAYESLVNKFSGEINPIRDNRNQLSYQFIIPKPVIPEGTQLELELESKVGKLSNAELADSTMTATVAFYQIQHKISNYDIQDLKDDGERKIKNAIRAQIGVEARKKYSSLTDNNKRFLTKVNLDLKEKDSKVWESVKLRLQSKGILIIDETDKDDINEFSRYWDDERQFKMPASSKVSSEIKELIYTTERIGETSEYSGLPKYLTPKDLDTIIFHLAGAVDVYDMMDMLNGLTNTIDESYQGIINKLNESTAKAATESVQDKRLQWYSFLNNHIPNKVGFTLTRNLDTVTLAEKLYNKTSVGKFRLADIWDKNINLSIEKHKKNESAEPWIKEIYAALGKYDKGLIIKGGLQDLVNNVSNENIDEIVEKLNKVFKVLSLDVSAEFIKYELRDNFALNQIARSPDLGINATTKEVQRRLLNERIITPLNYIYNSLKTIPDTFNYVFDQNSELVKIAAMYSKYTKEIEHNSIDINRNLAYSVMQSNYISNFFKLLHSHTAIGERKAMEYLGKVATVPGMQHDNILWNTALDNEQANGMLNFVTSIKIDRFGNEIEHKEPTSINREFVDTFNYRVAEGLEIVNTNKKLKYKDLSNDEYNLLNLISYIQDNEGLNSSIVQTPNTRNTTVLPAIIPSDKTIYYQYVINKIALGKLFGKDDAINRDSELFNAFRNIYKSQVHKIHSAVGKMYNVNKYGIPTSVKQDILDGKTVLEGVKYVGQMDFTAYIFSKNAFGGVKYDFNNDPLPGDVFSLKQLDFKDNSGTNISLNDKLNVKANIIAEPTSEQTQEIVDAHIEKLIANKLREASSLFEDVKEHLKSDYKYTGSINHTITEFLLNSFIFNHEQQTFFIGDNGTKRAFGPTAPSRLAVDESESGDESFDAVTIHDIKVKSELISSYIDSIAKNIKNINKGVSRKYDKEKILTALDNRNRVKKLNDLELKLYNIVKPYTDIESTDGQSYITLEEFERRTKKFGIYDNYKDVIEKFKNPNADITIEDLKLLLQPQKNFYYGRHLEQSDDGTYDFRSVQIKNSELILAPALLGDTSLMKLYEAMKHHRIAQVNYVTAQKTGHKAIVNLHDKNGNLVKGFSQLLKDNKEAYFYKNLGIQQELPSNIVDHKNKFGVQIAKLILNNLKREGQLYNFNGKPVNGEYLLQEYFGAYASNIKYSFVNLANDLGLNMQDLDLIMNPENIYDPNKNFTPQIEKLIKLLKKQSATKAITPLDMEGLEMHENWNMPNVPLFFSTLANKWQEIITNSFTRKVVEQSIAGPHAIQVTQAMMELNKLNSRNVLTSIQESGQTKLKGEYWDGNTFHPAEVLLPYWTKKLLAAEHNVHIDELDAKKLNIHIGYRIPTEDKHSMMIMRVVGFLESEQGASIVVPDEFVPRSGSDFDIDTVYMMSYALEKVDGDIQKIEYLTNDNSTVEQRYEYWVRDNSLPDTRVTLKTSIDNEEVKEEESIEFLRNQNSLPTIEQFKTLPIAEQNTTNARNNHIVDVFYSILSSSEHALEATTGNFSDDVEASRDLILDLKGETLSKGNELDYITQTKLRELNVSSVELKGIAVNILNFASLAQTMDVKVADDHVISIKLDKPPKGLNEKIYSVKSDGTTIATLSSIGRNAAGEYTNLNSDYILMYLSQMVSNILDAVKVPLPSNVNKYTLDVWSVIPSMGGTWNFSSLLINTNIFEEYSARKADGFAEYESSFESLRIAYSSNENKIDAILKERKFDFSKIKQTPFALSEQDLIDYIKDTSRDLSSFSTEKLLDIRQTGFNIYSTGKKVLGIADYVNKTVSATDVDRKSIGQNTYEVHKKRTKIAIAAGLIDGEQLSKNTSLENTVEFSRQHLVAVKDGIKTKTSRGFEKPDGTYTVKRGNKFEGTTVTLTGKYYENVDQLEDKDQWARDEGYTSFDDISRNVSMPAVKQFIQGKKGIWVYEISDVDTTKSVNPLVYVEHNGENIDLLNAIYEQGMYAPMSAYWQFAYLTAERILAPYFINKFDNYIEFHEMLDFYSREPYHHKKLDAHITNSLMSDNVFLSNLDDPSTALMNKQRLLGINNEYVYDLELNEDTFEQFKGLSLANKIDLVNKADSYQYYRDTLGDAYLLKYLDTKTKESDIAYHGYMAVNYDSNDFTDILQDTFLQMFTTSDEFIQDIADDIIRYNYVIHGLSFGVNSSKLISAPIIYKPHTLDRTEDSGIGLSEQMYVNFNNTTSLDISVFRNFLRSNPDLIKELSDKEVGNLKERKHGNGIESSFNTEVDSYVGRQIAKGDGIVRIASMTNQIETLDEGVMKPGTQSEEIFSRVKTIVSPDMNLKGKSSFIVTSGGYYARANIKGVEVWNGNELEAFLNYGVYKGADYTIDYSDKKYNAKRDTFYHDSGVREAGKKDYVRQQLKKNGAFKNKNVSIVNFELKTNVTTKVPRSTNEYVLYQRDYYTENDNARIALYPISRLLGFEKGNRSAVLDNNPKMPESFYRRQYNIIEQLSKHTDLTEEELESKVGTMSDEQYKQQEWIDSIREYVVTRQKAIQGIAFKSARAKEIDKELTPIVERNIEELNTADLLLSLSILNRHYNDLIPIIEQGVLDYNLQGIDKILENNEWRIEFNNDIKEYSDTIDGILAVKELKTLSSYEIIGATQVERDLNKAIAQLKNTKNKATELQIRLQETVHNYFEQSTLLYTDNPEIQQGIVQVFDNLVDETFIQLGMDPIFDTHNPAVANIIKKYRIDYNLAIFEATKLRRELNDILDKHGLHKKEDFEKFLERDAGKLNPKIIQKYNGEYIDILFDFRRRKKEIREKEGSVYNSKYLAVKREEEQWMADNLQSPFSDAYTNDRIKIENELDKNPAARKIVDGFAIRRNQILNTVGKDRSLLNKTQKNELANINLEKSFAQSTLTNKKGSNGRLVKKAGQSLKTAMDVHNYYKSMSDFYDLYHNTTIRDEFIKLKERAKKLGPEAYAEFLRDETVVEFTKGFWETFTKYTKILTKEDNSSRYDIKSIRNRFRDANNVIDGTKITDAATIKYIRDLESGKGDTKAYIPRAIPATNERTIYIDKYYDTVKTGKNGNSEVAKKRQAATKQVIGVLAPYMKEELGMFYSYAIKNEGDTKDLDSLIKHMKAFDLAKNMYDEYHRERSDEFYINEVRDSESFAKWFQKYHTFKLNKKEFEKQRIQAEKKGQIYYDKWLEAFTKTKIDEQTMKDFMDALSGIKSATQYDTPSSNLKLIHFLNSFRDNRGNIDIDNLDSEDLELLRSTTLELIEEGSHGDKGLLLSNYETAQGVLKVQEILQDDYNKQLTKDNLSNPFDILHEVATDQYTEQLIKHGNLSKGLIERLNNGEINTEKFRLDLHKEMYAANNRWYKTNHVVKAQGILPVGYFTKLRPVNEKKVNEYAPNDMFFSKVVVDPSWISKKKTDAATWINENVEFNLTKYYSIAKATARAGNMRMNVDGTVKNVSYAEWYSMNHYFDPYKGRVVPISIWKDMRPNNPDHVLEETPALHWRTSEVKKSEVNENVERDAYNNLMPREDSEFYNKQYDNVKNNEAYKKIVEVLTKMSSYYGKANMVGLGYLPSEKGEKEKDLVKRGLRAIGYYSHSPKMTVEGDNETLRFLDFPFIKLLSSRPAIKYDMRKEDESYEDYQKRVLGQLKEAGVSKDDGSDFKTLDEVRAENVTINKENKEHHRSEASYDVRGLLNKFIDSSIKYKAKKDMESELLNMLGEIQRMKFIKKDSKNKLIVNNKLSNALDKVTYAYRKGKGYGSNMEQHFETWMKMIFYDDFELDEGEWTKIARTVQNFTSAKGMWFNVTGAFNNVAYGNTQIAMESAASSFWQYKDSFRADKEYWQNVFSYGSEDNGRFKSKTAAIFNKFDVLTLHDERDYDYLQKEKNELFKKYMTTNTFFFLHHVGEHYMQNKALLAMTHSHRVVAGEIKSFTQFKGDLLYAHAQSVLKPFSRDEDLKLYVQRMQKKYDKTLKYNTNDYVWMYMKTQGKDVLKAFNDYLKVTKEDAKKEFNEFSTVYDTLQFNDGMLETDGKLSDFEIAKFKEKVIGVNHKIHGIYNKEDAATTQQYALGRLMWQFRKFLRAGWVKRFGARHGTKSFNERRQETADPSYITTWRFLTRPLIDAYRKEGSEEQDYLESNFMQRLLHDGKKYAQNVGLYYNILPDSSKESIRRTTMEMLISMSFLTVIKYALLALRGDDDENEGFEPNAEGFAQWMLYQQDRLVMESIFYTPVGIMNEGRKLLRTPVAAQTSVEGILRLLKEFTFYPFLSDEGRVYQSGIYSGETRLGVQFKRNVPIRNQIYKFDYLGKYYKLYGL